MARKAEEPIEKKKIGLFEGDFERLAEILAPKKVTPSVFIRHLVRRKLRQLEAALGEIARPVEVELDDIITRAKLDELGTPVPSDD
jgi:hypothetical protein